MNATRAKSYTRQQVMDSLHLRRRTFERLKAAGRLPFVEELPPFLKNHKLYRADLLDRYLAGEWPQSLEPPTVEPTNEATS